MSAAASSSTIQRVMYLQGAETVDQYLMDGHIITVIGELHRPEYKSCTPNSLETNSYTIAQFLLCKVLSRHPNTLVLLEFEPEKYQPLNSFNLTDIYNRLTNAGFKNNVEGFDFRSVFFDDRSFQTKLYAPAHMNTFLNLTDKEVIEQAVSPITDKVANTFLLQTFSTSSTHPNQWVFYKKFVDDLIGHSNYIKSEITRAWRIAKGKEFIIAQLQEMWKKVADMGIIQRIFNDSPSRNLVILCGIKHSKNIHDVFKDLSVYASKDINPENTNGCCNIKGMLI